MAEKLRANQATLRDTQAEIVEAKEEFKKIKAASADLSNEAKSVKKSLDIIANEGA